MSKTAEAQSLRGYRSMSEALEPIQKLAEWQVKFRPDIKTLRLRRKDYDLFMRWPMAGAALNVSYRDGRMYFMGLQMDYDLTEQRYGKKPDGPHQESIE